MSLKLFTLPASKWDDPINFNDTSNSDLWRYKLNMCNLMQINAETSNRSEVSGAHMILHYIL